MKRYFVPLIAAAFMMNACDDDSGSSGETDCKCSDGTECPDGDKGNCATTETCKCTDGTECPSGDASRCSSLESCQCDDGTECPGGEMENCTTPVTCTCWNGSECPSGNISECPEVPSMCKCWDGTECPSGDESQCPATPTEAEIILLQDNLVIDEGSDILSQFMLANRNLAPVAVEITTEGSCQVSQGSFNQSADDDNSPAEFIITATEDESLEDKTCKVSVSTSSTDPNYDGKTAEVTYTIRNTDEPALILSLDKTVIHEPIDYTEEPESITACLKLATQPTKDVVVKAQYTMSSFQRFSFASNGDYESDKTITISKSKYNADDNCVKLYAYRDDKVNDDSEPLKYMFIADENDYDSEYHGKRVFGTMYIQNVDSYDYKLKDSDGNIMQTENSLMEDEEITFKPLLEARVEFHKSIKIKAVSSDSNALSVSPASVKLTGGEIESVFSFTAHANNDNQVNTAPRSAKITFTVEGDDENFTQIASKEYTFNILDANKPSILMSCVPSEVRNIQDSLCAYASEEEAEGGFVSCSVKLGTKPDQNVVVAVLASEDDGYDKTRQELTFKPSNYYMPQKVIFKFRRANTTKITSVYGESEISASVVDSTKYAAPKVISPKFKRFFDCEYQFFKYSGDVDKAYLRKGTYDLYAWGASGSPENAKNMKRRGKNFLCNNRGGTGAYVRGTLTLSEPKNLFVYVGENGKSTGESFNGGGAGSEHNDKEKRGMSGGGATDFCIGIDNNCNSINQHYPYRILVAGGGGGGHSPDTCWSVSSTNNAYGGDAMDFHTYDGLPIVDFEFSSGYSAAYGFNTMNGKYFAPQGRETQNYLIQSSYNPNNWPLYAKHEELFGVGQAAVLDAKMAEESLTPCSSQGDFLNNNEFWRHGGGGGGWYGGLSANWTCFKSVGGGAGSSYAFTGTKHGQGDQDEKYALTNIEGRAPHHGGADEIIPRLSINDKHIITGLEMLDTLKLTCDDVPCFGNIGHGYALIHAQKK